MIICFVSMLDAGSVYYGQDTCVHLLHVALLNSVDFGEDTLNSIESNRMPKISPICCHISKVWFSHHPNIYTSPSVQPNGSKHTLGAPLTLFFAAYPQGFTDFAHLCLILMDIMLSVVAQTCINAHYSPHWVYK